ncbi:MAG: CHAD domain-containing protein [Planctomycetota bacterium]|jgi:CHAD domain-containing protein
MGKGASDGPKRFSRFLRKQIQARFNRLLDARRLTRKSPTLRNTHYLSTSIRRVLVVDSLFRQLYGQRLLARSVRRRLKAIRTPLGTLRDLDEIQAKWSALAEKHRSKSLPLLCRALDEPRSEAVDALQATLKRLSRARLIEQSAPSRLKKRCKAPLHQDPEAVLTDFQEEVDRLRCDRASPASPQHLHRLRIRFKWLRYAVELFAPTFVPADEEALALLKRIQTGLGEAHDWHVAEELCETHIDRIPSHSGQRAARRILAARSTQAHEEAWRLFNDEYSQVEALLSAVPQS